MEKIHCFFGEIFKFPIFRTPPHHQSRKSILFMNYKSSPEAFICFEGLAHYYSLVIIILTNNFPKSTFHFWLTNLVQMCVNTGVLTGCPISQNQEGFVRGSVGGIQG